MSDSKKQLVFILAVAAGTFLLYSVIRLSTEDDPARIRRAVYAAVLGLEKKDPARYGAIVSLQYQDSDGHNKYTLLKMVEEVLRDFEPIKCDVKQLTIEMKDKGAAEVTVGFKFYFRNMSDRKLYYEAARIRANFVKEGRSWRMRQLDYIDAKEIFSIQSVA